MEYIYKELFLRARSPKTERQLGHLGTCRVTPERDWRPRGIVHTMRAKGRVRLLKMVVRGVRVPRGERSE